MPRWPMLWGCGLCVRSGCWTAPQVECDRMVKVAAQLTLAPATFLSLVDEKLDSYLATWDFGAPPASQRQLVGSIVWLCPLVSE